MCSTIKWRTIETSKRAKLNSDSVRDSVTRFNLKQRRENTGRIIPTKMSLNWRKRRLAPLPPAFGHLPPYEERQAPPYQEKAVREGGSTRSRQAPSYQEKAETANSSGSANSTSPPLSPNQVGSICLLNCGLEKCTRPRGVPFIHNILNFPHKISKSSFIFGLIYWTYSPNSLKV